MTTPGRETFGAGKPTHSQRSLQKRNLVAEGRAPLGSSVKQAHRLKQPRRGICFQQMLLFLPRKYKDALYKMPSADKYKHICAEQRFSSVFIFFVFAELTIL